MPGSVKTPISNDGFESAAHRALTATTLSSEHYWAPAIYDAEVRNLLYREWNCVGRAEEVARNGDFFTRQIANESIIVVRDAEGTIRAHLNVCRHRGCEVVGGRGNTGEFKCPYHGWTYGLDGNLRGAPEMKQTKGFANADYPLVSLQVELWYGFIFVNFDPAAAPLSPRIGGLEPWVAGFDMSDQLNTREWEFEIDCNWKCYVENFIEEYHVPWVHGQTLQEVMPMQGWHTFPQVDEPWEMMWGNFPQLSWSQEGKPLFPLIRSLDEFNLSGMPLFLIYPMFMCIPTVDCTFYYLVFPEGPEKMRLLLRFAFPRATAEKILGGDPDYVRKAEEYYAGVDEFIPQDNAIAEKQQRGLRTRLAPPGRLCRREMLVCKVHEYLKRVVYDHLAPQDQHRGT